MSEVVRRPTSAPPVNTCNIRVVVQRKLTITIDAEVYERLHDVVGRGRISQFIERLVRPHVLRGHLDSAYREMAAEEQREADAVEWADAMIGDVGDETR